MTRDEGRLSTADLARTADEKSRRDEPVVADDRGLDRDVNRPPAAPAAAAEVRPVAPAPAEPPAAAHEPPAALFAERDVTDLRNRWTDVQTGFVDEPRRAVEQADALVAEVMKRLAESFAAERATLERQWDRGDNVTTEDLRMVMQRYRSFFDRLLSI